MAAKGAQTTIRDTDEYKGMDFWRATMIAEGVDEPKGDTEYLAAWQYLHDTRQAYSLQGRFGRTANNMVQNGLLLP